MDRYTMLVALALVFVVPLGCVPPPPPAPPVARHFVYTPPEQAKQLLPVTIALVRPRYEDPARMASQPQWARDTGMRSPIR